MKYQILQEPRTRKKHPQGNNKYMNLITPKKCYDSARVLNLSGEAASKW